MNLHVAGQFQVLQYRISNIADTVTKKEKKKKLITDSLYFSNKCYTTFKKYIRQHQALIAYCRKIEVVFNWIALEQVLMFSLLICLDGYQILMVDQSFIIFKSSSTFEIRIIETRMNRFIFLFLSPRNIEENFFYCRCIIYTI